LKKRKHSISVEDVEGVEKKIKKETPQVSCSEIKNNKKKKKKDKNKKSDLDDEQKNSSFEISDSENNQKALIENVDTSKLAEAITSDDDKKGISIEQNNTLTIIKKKRKRNKGKKVKLDTNLTSPVLRIMSK